MLEIRKNIPLTASFVQVLSYLGYLYVLEVHRCAKMLEMSDLHAVAEDASFYTYSPQTSEPDRVLSTQQAIGKVTSGYLEKELRVLQNTPSITKTKERVSAIPVLKYSAAFQVSPEAPRRQMP